MFVGAVFAFMVAVLWLPRATHRLGALPAPDLIVVLDGGSARLEHAERFRQQVLQEHPRLGRSIEPAHLLIRCPRASPPPQPMPELLRGYDTVTQVTALAKWLQHRQAPATQRIWIATDPDHTARAVVLARIALGSQGIRVGPADLPTSSPSEHRKLLRDALRFTLWRATGSTGAWLAPEIVARKRADCGV
jgi:uncharacterized SAM-binding protein YcdF (DUF218 family)